MRLSNRELADKAQWEKAGIRLPEFDREAMILATKKSPRWVHFGAGNIFRAFPAALAQKLQEQGLMDTGIMAVETYDFEIIDKCYKPFDDLCVVVTLKSSGSTDMDVIASLASSHRIDKDLGLLKEVFANPSLQMVSMTITEKGCKLADTDGKILPEIAGDFRAGPGAVKSCMGWLATLCHERYTKGAPPLALVSMDNCSHNGAVLFAAIEGFAKEWTEKGLVDKGFLDYVRDPKKLSFPWTMIDKIIPRPDDIVLKMLISAGLEDMQSVQTSKNTYVAPFVNAEEIQYLVIEDSFPNGRPALEKAGVYFTDQNTVDRVEKMKVCTCLNPLHSALAIFGCLMGFKLISEEMKNPVLFKLAEGIGYREGLPVVVDPGIINQKEFIDTVINERFPNPFVPDTAQRIAADLSMKIPVRFGETIKAYKARGMDMSKLVLIPLTLAGWLRYLLGIDDQGKPFEVSHDVQYENLKAALSGISLGQSGPFHDKLKPILSNPAFFAVNLYDVGLGERVESYFEELLAGPGAVEKTLKKYTG